MELKPHTADVVDALKLGREILSDAGQPYWRFGYTDMMDDWIGVTAFSNWQHEIVLCRTILSVYPELAVPTILHEVAHAIVLDANDDHGPKWMECFLTLGGTPADLEPPIVDVRLLGAYTRIWARKTTETWHVQWLGENF